MFKFWQHGINPASRFFAARRAGRSALVVTVMLAFALSAGCGSPKVDYDVSQGIPKTEPSKRVHIAQECKLKEVVSTPEAGTALFVVQQMLTAAARPNDPGAFERFFAPFDGRKKEHWVRNEYWPRAQKHVAKYLRAELKSADDVATFVICRRLTPKDGTVKFFIGSNDDSKSNPPITLESDDSGKWSVAFYTP